MYDAWAGRQGWWKVVPDVRHLLWVWDEVPPVRGIDRVLPFLRLWLHCLFHLLDGHCMMQISTDDGIRYACSKCEFKP